MVKSGQILPQPLAFWECYKVEFRSHCSWSDYCGGRSTTPVAIAAANAVIQNCFNLTPSNEYFRIDSVGYVPTPACQKGQYNWRLRVAFEHENDPQYACIWRDEFCKLAHIATDLCVVASYWDYRKYRKKNRTLESAIVESIQCLRESIQRIPNRQWLLIFGPRSKWTEDPFVAYTFAPYGPKPETTVQRLPDTNALWPQRDLLP